jgi:iron complex transport system ATP-binding protein
VLAVSHDLSLLARYADRLGLLADGRVEVGAPEALLQPARLRAAFGIEVDLLRGPDGRLLVVPRVLASAARGTEV